jgi:pimeloyl-ACP methyl ester carboxylesterase
VQAGTIDLYYYKHRDGLQNKSLLTSSTKISTEYYQQLIDHNRPDSGTFSQRYYIDESLSDSNDSPVFFYLCGEATCEPSALSGAIRDMAKRYHAKLVALEHRYYGASLPHKTLSTADLQDLSTHAALQDAAAFQVSISKNRNWNGKWIVFGGSYPGSLSAYYRLKFPDLVSGSLASSAPVQAKENFEEYDAHVTKVAGPACVDKMREATREIEASFHNPKRFAEIKRLFGAEAVRDNTDFIYMVADIGAAAVQYGYKTTFCNKLQNNKSALDGYADFAQFLYKAWGISDPVSLSMQGAESENPEDYLSGVGARQWFYQSCTEYGYWQNANSDPSKSSRSSMINMDYHRNVCRRLFGINKPANTDYINNTFYKPLMTDTVSNIFFTNGSTDPWSNLSMTVENGNAVNKNLHYYTIEGAAHCDDLRQPRSTDSESLKSARLQLSSLITDWLTT